MKSVTFAFLFVIYIVHCLPVQEGNSVPLGGESQSVISKLIIQPRSRRSPIPEPHHRSKIHAHIHIHGHYDEPSYYVKPAPVIQPIAQPVFVKPVPVVQPVVQPVAAGCNTCGGGGYGGGYGGSQAFSQASSQASSNSFSAGLNSPFGNLGYSSAQSSAQSKSSAYGK